LGKVEEIFAYNGKRIIYQCHFPKFILSQTLARLIVEELKFNDFYLL